MEQVYPKRIFLKSEKAVFIEIILIRHFLVPTGKNLTKDIIVSRAVLSPDLGWREEHANFIVESLPSESSTLILRNFILLPWCQLIWNFNENGIKECSSKQATPFFFTDSENGINPLNIHFDAIWRPIQAEISDNPNLENNQP